ncbi:DUF7768 domain-containing protein [Acidipropionibacterium jensenii]|uniref:DUF7768 domain-containing protein n=1 Tax=Acidipropionibacterium jensenii TaxID=1749 RepID=UPI00214B1A40|nr:hypothetical protein [Acidipropionibacterium jensenii]
MTDMPDMRTVSIMSPSSGDVRLHMLYARAAVHDALERGEAPFASLLIYTQDFDDAFASHLLRTKILNDKTAEERALGIRAGVAMSARCDATAVYTDLGISEGMATGIHEATRAGRPVVHRSIAGWAGLRTTEVPSTYDLNHLPRETLIRLGNENYYEYFQHEHDGWAKLWIRPHHARMCFSSLTIRTAALGEHDGRFMIVPAL